MNAPTMTIEQLIDHLERSELGHHSLRGLMIELALHVQAMRAANAALRSQIRHLREGTYP